MKCYNCGDDADMKVLVMINGKLQQVEICSKCYKEQMAEMVDHFKGQNGDFNPEELQKFMFKIFNENKEEFERLFGNMLNDSDFNLENIDLEDISFEFGQSNGSGVNFKDLDDFSKGKVDRFGFEYKPEHKDPYEDKKQSQKQNYKQYDFNEERNNKEIKMLKNSVNKKKEQLNDYVLSEDYMAAASLRDQIRDINKRIMIILELEKENER